MDERKRSSRIVFMTIIVCLCILVCVLNLINLQIVNGEVYYQASQKSVITTSYTQVSAARGEVYDRKGVPLITNRTVYSLGFADISKAEDELINTTIYNLLKLCDQYGIINADTLPMSDTASLYLSASTGNQERFDSYKAHFGWDQDLSATQIKERMCALYGLKSAPYDSRTLRKILGVRYELTLRNVLNIAPYVFAANVQTQLIAAIQEQKLKLVSVFPDSEREYNTKYAAHILGQVGKIGKEEFEKYRRLGYDMDELVGKGGIEAAFEEYLHGTRGVLETRTNAEGEIVSERYVKEPKAGSDVYLTIDIRMQEIAETSLKECIENLRNTAAQGSGREASGGAVVAIDVNTFDVLAMASYPTYDNSTYSQNIGSLVSDELKPLLNRATQGTYEPGSTFKMVTATAALESGAISVDTHIEDKGIYEYYAPSYTPACWIHTKTGGTHGSLNVSNALKVSCNYFFYEAARLTGIDAINKYAAAFGLGQSTGIEIDERLGILAGPESRAAAGDNTWTGGDTIQAGIGQSDNVFSPIQLACYIASVANGGNRYAAHLLNLAMTGSAAEAPMRYEGRLLSRIDLEEQTHSSIMAGMLEASESGTASSIFANYPIKVASKTGSAQTGLSSDNAVFMCCAPYDEPSIAVVVVVEQGGQGGLVGSVAKDVLDFYFYSSSARSIHSDNSLVE